MRIYYSTNIDDIKPLTKCRIGFAFKANNIDILSDSLNIATNKKFFNRLKDIAINSKYHSDLNISDTVNKVYKSCLNKDNTLNKDAVNAVLVMTGNKTNNFAENIKLLFKEHIPHYYYIFGITGLENIINECRDYNGNFNKKNLQYLISIDNKGYSTLNLSEHIKLIKNKNGIIDKEKANFYISLHSAGIGMYLSIFLDKHANLTPASVKLSKNQSVQKILNTNKNKYIDYQTFIENALQNINNNREEILDCIDKNIELLLNSGVKNCNELFTKNATNIDIENIKTVVNCLKQKNKRFIFSAADKFVPNILKDNQGTIRDENIEYYHTLLKKYSIQEIKALSQIFPEEIKDKQGIISKDFVELLTQKKIDINSNQADLYNIIKTKNFNELQQKNSKL